MTETTDWARCICYPTPVAQHYVYYGITEPGSAWEPCYTCPVHFPDWVMPGPPERPDDADFNTEVMLDPLLGHPPTVEYMNMITENDEPWPISGDELALQSHGRERTPRWSPEERAGYLRRLNT